MALAPRSTAPLLSSCQAPKPQGLPPEAMGSWKPSCLQEPPSTQLRVGDGVRVTLCPEAAGCLEQSGGQSVLTAQAHRAPVGVLAPLEGRARNFRGP